MKRLLLAGLIGLLGSTNALAGDDRREAIVGGALGGAAGAVIGQHVGGATGAAIGGALGGALGAGLAVDGHDHHRPAYYGGHAAPVAYYPARPVVVNHGHRHPAARHVAGHAARQHIVRHHGGAAHAARHHAVRHHASHYKKYRGRHDH